MPLIDNKGFTLIELLVVIAIVGVLSAVAFTTIGGSTNKARDAAIKRQLASFQRQVEADFSSGPINYGPSCGGSPANSCWVNSGAGCAMPSKLNENGTERSNLLIASQSGGVENSVRCKVDTNSDQWAAAAKLPTDTRALGDGSGNNWWCVDSRGASRQINDALNPIYSDDPTQAYCI